MGEESGSSVTVAVRLRPMNNREKALGTSCCVQMKENQTILTNIQGHVAHKTDKVNKKRLYALILCGFAFMPWNQKMGGGF